MRMRVIINSKPNNTVLVTTTARQYMCHCNKMKSESWLTKWTITISLQRKDVGLSEQADLVKTATLPFPIYNALNVKDGTSELVYNGKGICMGKKMQREMAQCKHVANIVWIWNSSYFDERISWHSRLLSGCGRVQKVYIII